MLYVGNKKPKLFLGNRKVKKIYCGTQKIYSSGNIVTYNVDSGTVYQEEVDSEASCLSPTTFTPQKSGYTFVGWREDAIADGNVLSSKIMDDEPITLYAVFEQTITLTYLVSGTSNSNNRKCYYNNGNVINPQFTISNPTLSGATFKGWSTSSSSTTVSYTTINNLELSANMVLYAVFRYNDVAVSAKSVDLASTYNGNTYAAVISGVDGTKYESIYFVCCGRMSCGTWATATNGYIYIGEVMLRHMWWDSNQTSIQDADDAPCYGDKYTGATVPLSNATNQTVYGSAREYVHSGNIDMSSAKAIGRTVVG